MGDFFDAKTKKNLENAKDRIQAVTTVYNMELAKLSQRELIYADVVTKYRQLLVSKVIEELRSGKSQEIIEKISKDYSNAEILKYISSRYHISNIPLENAELAVEGATQMSSKVFEIIEKYQRAIRDAYMQFDTMLRHCSPVKGILALKATSRENQYLNEYVNGVFAASEYNDLVNYIGRSVTGGMIVRDQSVVYPENPFAMLQHSKSKMELNKPVYMYSVDASKFIPSVCFELQHGTREDGSEVYFPDLRFGGEWTCRTPSLECKEEEEITYIPTSHLKEFQVFYKTKDFKFENMGKNREEYKKYLKKCVQKKQLGYVNDERDINAEL